jgi:uncharacterized protein
MAQTDDKARMEEILRGNYIGHLAMTVNGELYVVPLNYTYDAGRILFHCALTGRKLDMIRANPHVCFEVCSNGGPPQEHHGEKCDDPFVSVICWGTARVIDDLDERQEVLQAFQVRYATPEKPRNSLTRERAEKCGAVAITVTRMTGRQAQSEENARWEWSAEA